MQRIIRPLWKASRICMCQQMNFVIDESYHQLVRQCEKQRYLSNKFLAGASADVLIDASRIKCGSGRYNPLQIHLGLICETANILMRIHNAMTDGRDSVVELCIRHVRLSHRERQRMEIWMNCHAHTCIPRPPPSPICTAHSVAKTFWPCYHAFFLPSRIAAPLPPR